MKLAHALGALRRRVDRLECHIGAPMSVLDSSGAEISYRRFPKFWNDVPVRQAVIALREQATIDEAVAEITAKFGKERAPSRSSVHRCWQRLDQASAFRPLSEGNPA